MLDIFSYYSKYFNLKPNFSEGEITEIESMKEVKVAFSEIKCVNLKENTIEILEIHFSNNDEPNMDKKFLTAVSNFQNVQNMVHEECNFRR